MADPTKLTTNWIPPRETTSQNVILAKYDILGNFIAVIWKHNYGYTIEISYVSLFDPINSFAHITIENAKAHADLVLTKDGYTVLPDKLEILI
jgi:hypothetical protein